MNEIKILAFETSCDDTSVAIVGSNYKVLSNLVSSQTIHDEFGGVVPELASRLHIKNIVKLTRLALHQSGLTFQDIDALAVSTNPGLIGCLLVGVSFAKALAYSLNKPLIAVNHMLGHIYSNKIANNELSPPYLCLIISGGHTELVYFIDEDNLEVIGKTLDDAAGETFDKVAKQLNLGYPGGPIIDRISKNGDPNFVKFPRALNRKNNFNFSFSGLKTSVMTYLKNQDADFVNQHISDIASSVQQAIVDSLVSKTINYALLKNVSTIVMAGGVSANSKLRFQMEHKAGKHNIKLFYPPLEYCVDNAAMIGAAALDKYAKREFAPLDLNAFSTKGTRIL